MKYAELKTILKERLIVYAKNVDELLGQTNIETTYVDLICYNK